MSHHRQSRPNLFSRVWSKAVASNRRKTVSPARRRVWPQLECLEDRVVPAVINVNTTADIPLNQLKPGQVTLRDAIQIANTNGDAANTINLTVAGVYNISLAGTPGQIDNKAGEFAIFTNAKANQNGLSLTIQNTSGGKATINGNGLARVFDINPNNVVPANNVVLGTVTINDVTIENGTVTDAANPDGPNASGGGIRDQGPVSLILNRDILSNNAATADGGGVSMENANNTNWKLMLNNTTVVNNHAGDAGGGVEEDGTGQVVINNSTIADNTCLNQGAGVWLDAIGNGTSVLNVTNSVISGNAAGQLGGGIGQAGSSTVTISNSTVAHNFATGFGGGFADENNLGTLVVQNSLFLSNSAGTNGGGIATGGPSTTINNSEFKGNAAGINGNMPIGSNGGKPNGVIGSGGGLFVGGGTLSLTTSTIVDNTATINGGGLELQGNGNATLTNVTIAGNTALNSAAGNHGGGIDMTNFQGNLLLVNNTVTNNFATIGGGIYWAADAGAVISQNTLIALNTAATGPDVFDVQAGVRNFTDQGNNFIGINTQTNGFVNNVNGSQVGTTANPLNPMVTGLTNNGGPLVGDPNNTITLETEALLPGSLAIGKGKPLGAPQVDARGAPRIGAFDIGAFQFENVTLQLTINVQPSPLPLNKQATVTVEVLNTSGNPLPADGSTLTLTTTNGLTVATPTVTVGPLGSGQTQNFTFKVTGVAAGKQTITATVTSPDTTPTTTSMNTPVNVVQQFGSPPPGHIPTSSSPPGSSSSLPTLSPLQMALQVTLDTAALLLQGNALALLQLNNQSMALLGHSLPPSDQLFSSILSDLSASNLPSLIGLELGLSIANSVNGTTT
jgi:hypothetical protein